jgi:hypothetical protein
MADADVQITAGSGTKIDTRTVGTGADEHRQVVVVGDPTTAANVAPVDATNGLKVDVAQFKAEDTAHADGDKGVVMLGVRNHFSGSTTDGDYSALSVSSYGDLHTVSRRDMIKVSVQSSGLTTATTAYTAGDQVGTLFTVANAGRVTGGGGMIVGVVLISAADITGPYDVVFFDNTSVTLASDNAAFAISDTDALETVGIAQCSSFDIGNNRVAQAVNLAMPYVCSGGTSLSASLITRSSHTFFGAATDLQLIVYLDRY